MSRRLSPHLPALRRYARAVSTSQHGADGLVYAALAALVEDPAAPTHAAPPKLVLFRAFYAIWLPLERINGLGGASSDWAVFLLATMESFSPDETAVITGRTVADVLTVLHRGVRAATSSGCFGAPAEAGAAAPMQGVTDWVAATQRSLQAAGR